MSTNPFQAEIWPIWQLFGALLWPKLHSETGSFYTVTIN